MLGVTDKTHQALFDAVHRQHRNPTDEQAMADVVAPHRRTTALAIFNLGLTMIGGGLGPLFVGALSDALVPAFGQEALRGALAITMGSYVIGIVAFLAAIRPYATPNEPAPPRG